MRKITMAVFLLLCANGLAAQERPCGAGDVAAVQAEVALLLEPAAASPRLARRASAGTGGALAQAFGQAEALSPSLAPSPLGACTQLTARRDKRKRGGEAKADTAAPAAYKPKTRYDNTPWRFNMEQNGKRMTADEFDAWMKAKGVRVAKGAPTPVRKEDKRRRIARER
ncbi:hypothetical protein [Lysobacter sp. cf310]|uniref:hypothetical protein n=1 Tax=Lysobacter sp. cf310 TaxID=1761790 RepID=UPI0008DEB36C|nr:hypothetical protein [Lysobacter sp. cf310]SFK83583.1 hypothetical protein SAMN04487938_2248 [Lysobacter sp. cf310]